MDVRRRGSGSSDMSFFNKKELKKLCSLRLTTIQPRNVPASPDQKKVITPAPCIKVGICAMKKKTQSRPMQEILRRLRSFGIYDIIVFSNETILNEPIESWPIVECLIAFFSRGFPLEKAVSYVDLRRPFVLNDLRFQYLLQDRRQVYKLLESDTLVKIPRYAIINRDASGSTFPGETEVIESDDWIEVNGKIFHKPFVEKPVNAENHNICIYYPSKAGGGCQKLFRKVGNRSSIYCPDSCVRRTGSYIYEDFMTTDGTDVKTYTVGEEYAHAEARKSPALDGKVERDAKGKEIRYPVILSAYEKLVAKRVCKLFKQTVCGFDILRTNGKSLVCDVNGFSFVKTSQKYYDDCSQLLADIILTRLAPHWKMPQLMNIPMATAVSPVTLAGLSTTMELRSVVAIMRHGDRTPKQKVKMMVTHKRFFELFRKYDGPRTGALKLKQPSQLQEVLDITKLLLEGLHDEDEPMQEDANKLQQMKTVLEMYDHFSGINRKIQIKSMADQRNLEIVKKFRGRNKKSFDHNISSLLLILKWGGELTPMGEKQAEELGKAFRCLYPGGQGEYGNHPGLGFLRLHSTYRHDLKIYASDEGRVQMTAAAFAKGLLALEGGLTPILVHLVKSDAQVTSMLDYTQSDVTHYLQKVKTQLHDIMISNKNFTAEDEEKLAPCKSKSITEAMRVVQNPQDMCQTVYELVKRLTTQIREKCSAASSNASARTLYHEESLDLMLHRWSKLETDFINDGQFDISLIPDIYDCVKYNYVHNRFVSLDSLPELYRLTKALADLVVPQEYGISVEEKLDISRRICNRLLNKIRGDLQSNVQHPEETAHRLDPNSFLAYQTELAGEPRDITSPHRHVRTRLYFTSESHVHSVVNTLRYGPLFGDLDDEQWENAMQYLSKVSELNYLTQIVFMQYEDLGADPSSPNRFHTEIFFSPGLKTPDTEEIAFDLFNMSANLDDYPENRDVFVQVPVKVPSDDAVLGIKNRANLTGDRSPIMKRSSSADELASAAGKSLAIRPMSFSSDATFSSSLSESQAQPVTGAEVIYTLPYLQPLVALHSSVSQEQMDAFFDVMTTEDEEHNLIWSTALPGKVNSFHGVSYEHPLVEQMRC